jgi:hypothetical protein
MTKQGRENYLCPFYQAKSKFKGHFNYGEYKYMDIF